MHSANFWPKAWNRQLIYYSWNKHEIGHFIVRYTLNHKDQHRSGYYSQSSKQTIQWGEHAIMWLLSITGSKCWMKESNWVKLVDASNTNWQCCLFSIVSNNCSHIFCISDVKNNRDSPSLLNTEFSLEIALHCAMTQSLACRFYVQFKTDQQIKLT